MTDHYTESILKHNKELIQELEETREKLEEAEEIQLFYINFKHKAPFYIYIGICVILLIIALILASKTNTTSYFSNY